MKLLPDWKSILTRAWSIRFIVLAAVLTATAEVLNFLVTTGEASAWMRMTAAASLAMAAVARIVQQENLSGGGE